MKLFISVIVILLLTANLFGDDAEEKLFSVEEETFHANELSEMLSQIKANPLNINISSKTELQDLPWLSENDITLIIKIRKNQVLCSWKDLEKLGINKITLNELHDYIVFRNRAELHLKQQTRIEYSEAKSELISSLKYYQKTLAEYGHFKAGVLTQKDEGERDLFDFYTYFLQYTSEGFLQNCVLGKYRLALGQGILFAPKLGMSKSAEATSVPVKKYSALKPYTSSYEIWGLEGCSFELTTRNWHIIPFISRTKLNANLDSLDKITSFNESGLNLDEAKKNNVQETLYGSAIEYITGNNQLGCSYSLLAFDHEFSSESRNSKYQALNLYCNLFNKSYPMFSEIAMADKKLAGLAGAKFGDAKFRQMLLVRNYEKDFPGWHGNPFSAQSNFANETGLYYGVTILPRKNTKINCYFDIWSFPGTRYFEKMPTVGSDQFLQLETRINNNTFRFTIQNKQKEKYITLDEAKIRDFERLLLRLDWWQKLGDITMKSRAEWISEYLSEDKVYGKGVLFYEQAKIKLEKIQIIAQVTAYHTVIEPFKVKHYMYENNVSGIMQNSVFSGDGMASYLLVRYDLFNNIQLQTKISDSWQKKNKMRLFLQLIGSW
jgi:hypothetical protein